MQAFGLSQVQRPFGAFFLLNWPRPWIAAKVWGVIARNANDTNDANDANDTNDKLTGLGLMGPPPVLPVSQKMDVI